ncbi:hypothetical protein AGLY_008337 [Aphis glycines]|uniref:Tectonic domain-containing protein n=1 Tax=Aphis glycines TaxID=307491 RepID=A0A6G0TLJ3_APHGL|nr:hypothetical protein AGLY_008337 [Aphis glycines]
MEKSFVVSIVLFAVFIIPEISCENAKCLEFKELCFKDEECCSDNCQFTGNPRNSFCMEPKNSTLNDPKIEEGQCSYNKSFHEDQSHATYERFGINAAHAILPVFTKVQLKYNNKTLDVIINGFPKTSNNSILELSREAALMLDIEKEGLYPCSIGVYEPEPDYTSLKKIVTVTASFFVVVLLIITFF